MKKLTDLYEVTKKDLMSNGDKKVLTDFLTLYYTNKNHQIHGTEVLSNIKYDRVLDKETLKMLWTGALILNYMKRNHPDLEMDECPNYVEEAFALKTQLGIDSLTFSEVVIMTEEIYDIADEVMEDIEEVFEENIFNGSRLQDTFIHILANEPKKVSEFFNSIDVTENLKEIADSDLNFTRNQIEKFLKFLFANNGLSGTSDGTGAYTLRNLAAFDDVEIVHFSNEIKKTIEICVKVSSLSSKEEQEEQIRNDINNYKVVEKDGYKYSKSDNYDIDDNGYVLPEGIRDDITDLMRKASPNMDELLNPNKEETGVDASVTKLCASAVELVKIGLTSVSTFTKPELEEFLMFVFKEQYPEKYESKKEAFTAEIKDFIYDLTDKGVAKVTNEIKSIVLRFLEPSSK